MKTAQWTFRDLTIEQRDSIYKYTKESYDSSGLAYSYTDFWGRANEGKWVFYGNSEMTGYICGRDLSYIPGLMKLTGCAGDPKGILAGISLVKSRDIAIVGVVTPNLYNIALKRGMVTLGYKDLQKFLKVIPGRIWGGSGKPTLQAGAILRFEYNGRDVDKHFICNEKFISMAKSMFGMDLKAKVG